MTELAALNVRITGDATGLKAAVAASTTSLQQVGASATAAQAKVGGLGAAFSRLGTMSNSTKSKIQNVAFQVQDMAVQLAAGTRASTVFAQQGSQIAGAFGPVGAIIGVVAAVALPLLAVAFTSAGGSAKTFQENLDAANEALDRLRGTSELFSSKSLTELVSKYGEMNIELARFIDLQSQIAERNALIAVRDTMQALKDETAGWINDFARLNDIFPGIAGQVNHLAWALDDALDAKNVNDQLEAVGRLRAKIEEVTGGISGMTAEQFSFYQKVIDSEDALRQLAVAAPKSGILGSLISEAETLAGKLWDAVTAKAALSEKNAGAPPPGMKRPKSRTFKATEDAIYGVGGGGGGGGGGGTNPVIGELESLRKSLMSQEQLQIDSFARQQETLTLALQQRLITQQEYAALMQQAQQQHSDAMTQIDVWRYGTAIDKAGAFFGVMADTMAAGNEKMQRVGQAFAAVEALINAWRAYNQTLADPSLPFFAKFAAAAQVLAAGMGAVNAIKGGGKGGGASSSQAAAAAPTQAPLQVSLSTYGFGDFIRTADMGQLLTSLNKSAGDRGYTILVPA